MSDATTSKMLRPFIESAPAPMFLSGFFQSPPENRHDSEDVEIDIQRDGEDVAVAIKTLAGGRRYNENDKYSNKKFTPPIFKEAMALNGFQLMGRDPGENPFANPLFQAKATVRAGRGSTKLQNKIGRSIELMASQVFQTGVLTCKDENGVAIVEIDFDAKNNHFVNAAATWAEDGSAGNPITDLENLAHQIRTHGRVDPDVLVFGRSAWLRFINNAKVQKFITRDGLGVGQLAPAKRGKGATFQGFVWIGSYRFEMWTYTGGCVDPQTKDWGPYIDDNNVVMATQTARLDLTFGGIPQIVPTEGRVLTFLPRRVSDTDTMIDLVTSAWVSPDGETLTVQLASRPLTIPTEIDSFGCLDVIQA
jgi:hypothetical protein